MEKENRLIDFSQYAEFADCAVNEDVSQYKAIVENMTKKFIAKNHDYGNSFSESVQEFGGRMGLIVGFAPIMHKFNRAKNIIRGTDALVIDETVHDTLLDMANYCIMLAMEYDKLKQNEQQTI